MGSFLDRVEENAKQHMLPPRIVPYGVGGVGKTTFGMDANKPILMPLEDGKGKLKVKPLDKPGSYTDVMNMIAELANDEHDYRTLVIDTVDKFEPLVWREVCENEKDQRGKKHSHIEGFGYGAGYKYADPYWIRFFDALDVLRSQRSMTIIVLAHSQVKTIQDPNVGPYARTQPKLQDRANDLLFEWADIVGLLEIQRKVYDPGEGDRTLRTSRTTGQRILRLEDGGGYAAKNKYDLAPEIEIPKENPFGALRAALNQALDTETKKESEAA